MLQQNKYADHIALHQKCLDILSARETFVRRLNLKENDLARWSGKKDTLFHLMVDRSSIVHDIEILTMAVNRITAYYEKHAGKVCAMLAPMDYNTFVSKFYTIKHNEVWTAPAPPVFGQIEAGIAHSEDYGYAELNSHKIPPLCDFCVKPEGNDFSVIPLMFNPDGLQTTPLT